MFCWCYFLLYFITIPLLKTNYLRLYWTDLHQIFRIGTDVCDSVCVCEYDQSDFLLAITRGTLLW